MTITRYRICMDDIDTTMIVKEGFMYIYIYHESSKGKIKKKKDGRFVHVGGVFFWRFEERKRYCG